MQRQSRRYHLWQTPGLFQRALPALRRHSSTPPRQLASGASDHHSPRHPGLAYAMPHTLGPSSHRVRRGLRVYGPDPQPQSEDSLLLNVWTPATPAEPCPVVVLFTVGRLCQAQVVTDVSWRGIRSAPRPGGGDAQLPPGEGGSLYLGHLDTRYATSREHRLAGSHGRA